MTAVLWSEISAMPHTTHFFCLCGLNYIRAFADCHHFMSRPFLKKRRITSQNYDCADSNLTGIYLKNHGHKMIYQHPLCSICGQFVPIVCYQCDTTIISPHERRWMWLDLGHFWPLRNYPMADGSSPMNRIRTRMELWSTPMIRIAEDRFCSYIHAFILGCKVAGGCRLWIQLLRYNG